MNNKMSKINLMLDLIIESSHPMPDCVFRYYFDSKKKPEEKIFYNLIADSFLTLYSFCILMKEKAWSQASALLRVGIEQVSAVFILCNIEGALKEYIDLHALRIAYSNIDNERDRKAFLNEKQIKNRYNDYFDYSWISKFTHDGDYGRDQMIKLAHLEEFIDDIKQILNPFIHGSVSVFEMSNNNWDTMKKHGRRSCLTCCKLFDFLCCSFYKLIGDEEFKKLPLNTDFIKFKKLYHSLFIEEGWVKSANE